MSTRSLIAIESEKEFKGVYCHWDGYPDYNGRILVNYYQEREKVEELISMGDISSLGKDIGKKHEFGDRSESVKNMTTFYHRDREEELSNPIIKYSLSDLLYHARDLDCEFVYIFTKEDKWKCYCLATDKDQLYDLKEQYELVKETC